MFPIVFDISRVVTTPEAIARFVQELGKDAPRPPHRSEKPKDYWLGRDVEDWLKHDPAARIERLQNTFARLYPNERTPGSSGEAIHSVSVATEDRGQFPRRGSSGALAATDEVQVFISHSSKDEELAGALVEFLQPALQLHPSQIRCTSVAGYKLPVGTDTDEVLRKELLGAPAFIGLMSKASLSSTYVLFELGGRWAAQKFIAPVLGPGMNASDLQGPLRGLTAISCVDEADLHQLVRDLGRPLGRQPEPPTTYLVQLKRLMSLAGAHRVPGDDRIEETVATSGPSYDKLFEKRWEIYEEVLAARKQIVAYGKATRQQTVPLLNVAPKVPFLFNEECETFVREFVRKSAQLELLADRIDALVKTGQGASRQQAEEQAELFLWFRDRVPDLLKKHLGPFLRIESTPPASEPESQGSRSPPPREDTPRPAGSSVSVAWSGRGGSELSEAAHLLLLEAARSDNGIISSVGTGAGHRIEAGGRNFVESRDPRSEAKWIAALRELERVGLVEDRAHKGEVFVVTHAGYEYSDGYH